MKIPLKMVYRTLDQLEPMSREELNRLAAMTDEEIDYSDIPPSPPEKWKQAVRGGFCCLIKQPADSGGDGMRDEYDFSGARKNSYAKRLISKE